MSDFYKIFPIFLLLLRCHFSLSAQGPAIESPPNIILVLVDDLGTEALGAYGGTSYATPVLDQMAREGVQFHHAYAYPLCTPTRVSLMTGKYNFRNWKAFGILDPKEKTFGHYLREQGYKTCLAGKWQLRSYDPPGYPGADLRRNTGMKIEEAGFDEYCAWHVGHTEDKGSRFPSPVIYQNGTFLENTHGQYGPDIFSDFIMDFIDRHRDEPFFIYYPMVLTHNPFSPSPDSDDWSDPTLRFRQDTAYFADMVEYTDKIMGRLIQQLEKNGLREETLLIFYSDNGTDWRIQSKAHGQIVQGGKGKNIDTGTRVPMIVQWKGKAKEGLTSHAMVAPSDFLPTFFEALQRPMPNGSFTDGESFLSALTRPVPERRDWVLIDHNPRPGRDKENFLPAKFVKGPRYKLYEDGRFFDTQTDPYEQSLLAPSNKEQKDLHRKYQNILDSLRRYRTFGYLERFDPAFDQVVPPSTKIEVIAEGFNWSEGPVWVPQEQCLLFSDVPRNMVYKWTDTDGIEVFLRTAGYSGSTYRAGGKGSNGLALDEKGRLLLCRQGDREVARLASGFREAVPVFEPLAKNWKGQRLNSPNDLVVDRAGNIYFTDPPFGLDPSDPEAKELSICGIYRINKKDHSLLLLDDSLEKPNGIALSPDETKLYVANSNPPQWFQFEISKDGKVQNKKLLFDGSSLFEKSLSKQVPDGMAVNREGILFATGPDGVIVLSPEGKHLGTIRTNKRTSNCTFNEDETILYVSCDDYILRIILGYRRGFTEK